jgi:hypothetical protein
MIGRRAEVDDLQLGFVGGAGAGVVEAHLGVGVPDLPVGVQMPDLGDTAVAAVQLDLGSPATADMGR